MSEIPKPINDQSFLNEKPTLTWFNIEDNNISKQCLTSSIWEFQNENGSLKYEPHSLCIERKLNDGLLEYVELRSRKNIQIYQYGYLISILFLLPAIGIWSIREGCL